MPIIKHTLLILICCALFACGAPELPLLNSDSRILAFGDSLTQGVGTSRQKSYPAVLSQLTGLEVINAGISGETTYEGIERLPSLLESEQPDLLILLEGGNDILRNMDLTQTKANLSNMIKTAQQQGIPVILIGVPRKNLFSDSASLYHQLAEEHGLVFIESLVADMMRTPRFKSDSIHFNADGYQHMAEKIHQVLQDKGALKN